jgi:hypothetical protein
MFWKRQSKEEQIFKSAAAEVEVIKAIAQVQTMNPQYLIKASCHQDNNVGKIINYIYYDFLADIYAYKLCGHRSDIIKAYIRDSALSEVEFISGEQFRTYTAKSTSFADAEKNFSHSPALLSELKKNPVFEFMLRKKVEVKIEELIDRILIGHHPNREDLDKISKHLVELHSDDELAKVQLAPVALTDTILRCGLCSVEEGLENINVRDDAKLYLYKTNERRAADDLEIYSCICFDCGGITEFSFDPYNFSDNASAGVEYFRSYLVDKSSLKLVFEQMRSLGHPNAILRLISKHPDKIV